jgi:hypothetical protein
MTHPRAQTAGVGISKHANLAVFDHDGVRLVRFADAILKIRPAAEVLAV